MVIDYRETLVTYLRSETVEEAANTLKISKSVLNSRVSVMRKRGVNVPHKTKRALSDLDVAQLNSIIRKFKEEK